MKKVFVVCAAAALVLGMAGCASTKSVDPTLKVNVDDGVDKVVVIDWTAELWERLRLLSG